MFNKKRAQAQFNLEQQPKKGKKKKRKWLRNTIIGFAGFIILTNIISDDEPKEETKAEEVKTEQVAHKEEEPKEEVKEQPKEQPKEEPKEEVKEEPKEEVKKEKPKKAEKTEKQKEKEEYDRLDKEFAQWTIDKADVIGNVKVDRENQVVEIRVVDEWKLLNENELQYYIDMAGQNAYGVLGDNPNKVHLRFLTMQGKMIAEESILDLGHGIFKLK